MTKKQRDYILRLLVTRSVDDRYADQVREAVRGGNLSVRGASALITDLQSRVEIR